MTASSASGVPACCAMPIVRRLAVSRASSEPRLPRRGNQNSLSPATASGAVRQTSESRPAAASRVRTRDPGRFISRLLGGHGCRPARPVPQLGARDRGGRSLRQAAHPPSAQGPPLLEEIDNERSVLAQAQASTHHHTHHPPPHPRQGRRTRRTHAHAVCATRRGAYYAGSMLDPSTVHGARRVGQERRHDAQCGGRMAARRGTGQTRREGSAAVGASPAALSGIVGVPVLLPTCPL